MYKYFFYTSILYLTMNCLEAQSTFSKRFHLDLHSAFFTSIEANNDHFIVSALVTDTITPYRSSDVVLVLDQEGNILENKIHRDTTTDRNNWGRDITIGNFIVKTGNATSDQDRAMLFAYDTEGDIQWEVQQTGFFDSTLLFIYNDVVELNDKIYVVGYTRFMMNQVIQRKIILSCYSLDGQLLNYSTIDTPNWQGRTKTLEILNDSLLLIGGSLDDAHIRNKNFHYYAKLWAIDTLGNLQWQWRSPTGQLQQGVQDMVITDDGGIVIASTIGTEIPINSSSGDLYWDCYVYKLNSDLEQEWGTYFRHNLSNSFHQFNKIIETSDGSGFIAIGRSSAYFPDADPETENGIDIGGIIAKVSPQGDSLWSRIIIHPNLVNFFEWHHFYDIEETGDGGFIMVGESRSSDTIPQQQGWLLKVDEWGCLVPDCHLPSAVEEGVEPMVKLLLYPNPVQDVLNVYLGATKLDFGSTWRVYNLQGQEILRYPASQGDATYVLEVDKLPKGSYFLQLQEVEGKVLAQERFVVQ